ncbi:laccase [Heterobasidion irregulare TC 32-1]|uniref:Laccase n=1 Tax=Heterobasidion irregulare (strain TC 32-1) TaxID=747525 RepID=W4KFM8_HETIT|nr:laccase [Heterobasidion irregulare TC 32-1]ETW84662.1 laccase [Heterobasidion irregulare TC 32-1]
MQRLQRFVLASLSISSVFALSVQGPTAPLQIVNKQLAPDGFQRDTVLANGEYPGPLIKANKGDHFQINVTNSLTDTNMDTATSIHWHGLFQHGTNWADGPSFVNQCPIVPGNSFVYSFDAPGQAGTWWYHSHLSAQYCDGLRGPLVIYDPNDPHAGLYDVDDENTVITLGDWYHYLSTNPPASGPPAPSSILINGLGRYISGPADETAPLAVVGVEQGKRYRFRLVSISCDSGVDFSIDQHNLTIIEADGSNTEPLVVDSVTILAGQRYSVVVTADQAVDNYWIRAQPGTTNIQGFDNGRNSAILRYSGAAASDPTTALTTSTSPMVETNLHALENPSAPGNPTPGGADINYTLDVAFVNGLFEINGTSFTPPTVPVLLQILSGAKSASDLLPKGSIYALEPNKSVELLIPGGVLGGPHPIHLHGHSFSVVRSAGSTSYNFDNPVRRDVVSIGTESTDQTTIRFFTDNPGPWFIHCHIDWHLTAGFAAVMAEDVAETPLIDPTPDSWNALCPAYNAASPKVKVATAPKKLKSP